MSTVKNLMCDFLVALSVISFSLGVIECDLPFGIYDVQDEHESNHKWLHSQDIGNRVRMQTTVQFLENVIRSGTGERVRPLSIHADFLYGRVLMQQVSVLRLHTLSDVTPLVFTLEEMDPFFIVPREDSFSPLSYVVTMTPKAGFSWGTITGTVDMDIVAVEQ